MYKLSYQGGFSLTQAYKLVRERVYTVLENYGLNYSHWVILAVTANTPDGISPSTLAEIMLVKPPLVTLLAKDLVDQNLVRQVQHSTDKRAKLLIITPHGSQQYLKIEYQIQAAIAQLLEGVELSKIKAFEEVLETIIRNAEKTD